VAVLRNDTGVVVCHGRMKSELLWLKPTISAMVFVGSRESEDGIQYWWGKSGGGDEGGCGGSSCVSAVRGVLERSCQVGAELGVVVYRSEILCIFLDWIQEKSSVTVG